MKSIFAGKFRRVDPGWQLVLLGIGLLALLLVPFAYTQAAEYPREKSALFTSPDRIFQVRYPKKLQVCTHRDGENPDIWSPEECMAEIPVCDSSGHAGNVLMCLAYPTGEFPGSELKAAALAVNRIENLGAKECVAKWARSDTSQIRRERIGSLPVAAAKAREAAGAYVEEQDIYRVYHQNACYELDVNLTTALSSAFAAEDAPRKLSSAERAAVKDALMQALHAFRFLK